MKTVSESRKKYLISFVRLFAKSKELAIELCHQQQNLNKQKINLWFF
jgi:hypothetical protein